MGCLNSGQGFGHWFGNVHLSGPCNRSCYFCIGQHMMALDGYDVLGKWPLAGWGGFVSSCAERGVSAVYLTGTNTDPILYRHHAEFTAALRRDLGVPVGLRTNGVSARWREIASHYDCGSLTVCSVDPAVNARMMGGPPASNKTVAGLLEAWGGDLKVNIVLGPENRDDCLRTVGRLAGLGVSRFNLREPYGQPFVGDPVRRAGGEPSGSVFGMPVYEVCGAEVCYWDVHYCEVESVNLYASGRVSVDYPISRGHAPDGFVLPQSEWSAGRHVEQWQGAADV